MANVDSAQLRLYNQRIAGTRFAGPYEVVHWLGALQAQDYLQALWAIGLRTQQSRVADIEQAISDGKILRTWPMRGTIHFVPAEDARWMLKLSAPRMLARGRRRLEQLGLDEETMERSKELFYNALTGGKRLSRPMMMKLLEEAGISTQGQRGYHMLWYSSQTGLICLGPMQDKQQTFVLLDEWVPHSRQLSREEALAELARRYFTSHGPATIHDFAWWAGLTIADAKVGLEAAKAGFLSEIIHGIDYWMSTDAPGPGAFDSSDLYLLPGFDEYLLGYTDRSAVLAREHAAHIVPGNNGIFLPTLVIAGQVAGTWKRTFKKNVIDIALIPFTHVDDLEERASEATRRYRAFFEAGGSATGQGA